MAAALPVVLLCCYNRRVKTLKCLQALFAQGVALRVVLVDDASTDGTADAVRQQFPQVQLLTGTGQLYWTGAMRLAWQHALTLEPAATGFIWLNDDVELDPDALKRLFNTIDSLQQPFGAVLGAMRDPVSGEVSYGGRCSRSSWFPLRMGPLLPNSNELQRCDFIHGNLCFIPAAAVAKIGILSADYTHSIGDYDYGLRLKQAGLPCFVAPGSFGLCADNSPQGGVLDKAVPFAKRLAMLKQPNRWAPADEYRLFVRRHGGPFRLLLQLPVLLRQYLPWLFLWLRQRDFTAQAAPAITSSIAETSASERPVPEKAGPKVYQLHQRYRQRGGEDVVVEREADLFAKQQLPLQQIIAPPLPAGWRAQVKAISRWFGCTQLPESLQMLQPGDILLVHNLFPALSPFMLPLLKRRGVRVVLTLHNFRQLTPAAVLAPDEQATAPSVALIWRQFHRPARAEGRLLSVLLASAIVWQHRQQVWHQVEQLWCPSDFVRRQFLAAGYPSGLLTVKPHYCPASDYSTGRADSFEHMARLTKGTGRNLLLFVGRDDPQKGLSLLLEAYQTADPNWPDLYLAGVSAPDGDVAFGKHLSKVHYCGQLGQARLGQLYQRALLLVVPSTVAETFGNVIIEAFACGVPVLAARAGAFSELIQPGYNGDLFNAGNAADLQQQLAGLLEHPARLAELSAGASQSFTQRYNADVQWHFYQALGVRLPD